MRVTSVLTQENAEMFLMDNGSVDLTVFADIDEAAAESLAKHRVFLDLSGLKRLSGAAAKRLGEFGGILSLEGLRNLSDSAAQCLSKHKRLLLLSGLKSLSDSAAESLGKHKGPIFFNGLTNLSDSAAESLRNLPGPLELNGLTSLSDTAVMCLSKHRGSLCLSGLTSLSDLAAESFGNHVGLLSLDGLTSVSDTVAESLSKHRGSLDLSGLTSLSELAAESFGDHMGSLFLGGLTSVSATVAKSLRKHRGPLDLSGLTHVSDTVAKRLSKHRRLLDLGGLTRVSDTVAEILQKHRGPLELGGLTSLSDPAAKSLSNHYGSRLCLTGLKTLSVAAAKSLNDYHGELSLRLDRIPRKAAAILRRHLPYYDDRGPEDRYPFGNRDKDHKYQDDGPRTERPDAPGTITNSVGIKFVPIIAGTAVKGSPEGGKDRYEGETPPEAAPPQDFYLGVTQVTQAQYEQVMGKNPSHFQGGKISWRNGSCFPVERVSWEDAVEFCRELSELPEERAAGRVYRLPTESEWVYACRAGSTTAYSCGEDRDSLDDYAWFSDNSVERPHPVGLKEPNAWGLYDMLGNVLEWCAACHGAISELKSLDPTGPVEDEICVSRGGSWFHHAARCKSTSRLESSPSYLSGFIGFRLALDSSTTPK